MGSDILQILDHNYFYRGLASFYYFIYLLIIFDLPQDQIAILPSPILLILTNTILFILVLCSQEVKSTNYQNFELVKWLTLSLIPPLLGVYFLYSWIQNQRKRKEQTLIILGPTILAIIMLLVAIGQLVIIIISLFVGSIAVLYIPFASVLGFLGVVFADKYSQITEVDVKTSEFPKLQKYFNHFLSKIVGQQKNRIISSLIFVVLLFGIYVFRKYFTPILL